MGRLTINCVTNNNVRRNNTRPCNLTLRMNDVIRIRMRLLLDGLTIRIISIHALRRSDLDLLLREKRLLNVRSNVRGRYNGGGGCISREDVYLVRRECRWVAV